jgi:hypothetical protein
VTDPLLAGALAELGRELAETDVPLFELSDAEVAAVTPNVPAHDRLVALPALDRLPPGEREHALEEAQTRLVERGILVSAHPFEPSEELLAVLELRANPSAIVMVDRTARVGENYSMYLYGIADAGFLCEIASDDRHEFAARSIASVVDLLVDSIDPHHRAAGSDGPPLERAADDPPPDGWDELERAVAASEVIMRLSSTRKVGPDTVEDAAVTFSSGPGGVWGGSGYQTDDGRPVAYGRSLSSRSLREAVSAFVGEGMVAVRTA